MNADSGEIVAVAVTREHTDHGAVAEALPDQIVDPIAFFTVDGTSDLDRGTQTVAENDPDAAVLCPRASRPRVCATQALEGQG